MANDKQQLSLAEDTDFSFLCYRAVKEARKNARENLQLLALVYSSMSNLCTDLDKLDSFMESIIFCTKKENGK